MANRYVIHTKIVIILMLGYISHSRLLKRPENTFGWVGINPQAMRCSSDIGSNAITWYFVLFDTTNNVTVAVGPNVTQGFTNLFTIDQPNATTSNLIIPAPSNLTAGTYTCSDRTDATSVQNSLTYGYFEASTNLTNSSKNGDIFHYSCSVNFYGNDFVIPQFILFPKYPAFAYNVTNPKITKIGSLRNATGTVFKTVTCGLQFPTGDFFTIFSVPRGNLPSGSATNAPGDIYATYGFMSLINVACVPSDADVKICCLSAENVLYYGSIMTCTVPSSSPVNYTWTDFTYGNTSKGQQLRIWHNGTYQCNASVELDRKIYPVSRTLNNIIVKFEIDISLMASPLYGPIAGGTNITFVITHWPDQIKNISTVYVGNSLSAAILISDRQINSFIAISPAATDDLVQQKLQLAVELTPGLINVTTDLYFAYRSNPEITNIFPNNFIVTGGTSVNVSGVGLSSVSNPQIQVTVDVTRANALESFSNTTTDSCRIMNSEGTEMVCNMPPVDIPNEFQDIIDSSNRSNKNPDKVKPTSSVLEVIGPNGIDRASVYLGFILDGYKKYRNINDALPDTKIFYYSSPEINSSPSVYDFDSSTDELFLIQGNHLTLGCRLSDYVVHVGNDVCEVVDLQDNVLTVRLPKKEPQVTQNDSIVCGKYLSVRIIVGYKVYHYSCLRYYLPSSYTVLIIAVCVGVGGFLFLLFTIIGIVCCCRNCRKNRSGNNHRSSQSQSLETADRSNEVSNDYSKANEDYKRKID